MKIREEDGSGAVMGLIAIVFMLTFFVFSMEMVMYYTNYKRLQQSVKTVNMEVRSMLPYYAYSDGYKRHFSEIVSEVMGKQEIGKGDIYSNIIIRSAIRNETTISVSMIINTKYKCKLTGIMGIHQLPIRLQSLNSYSFETRGKPGWWDEVEIWNGNEEEGGEGNN